MNRTPRLLASLFVASLLPACAARTSDSMPVDDVGTGQDADASAVAWRASSVAALDGTTGPATSISVATPAGTAQGDVEIAAVASYGATVVTAPSGWALVKSQADTTTTVGHAGVATFVFSHVAGASEPASVSFALSAKGRGVATIQSYANVDPASPIDGAAGAAETKSRVTHTTPSITTSADGDVLVGVFATVNPLEPASTKSSMGTERVDRSSGDAGSWGIDLALYDSLPRTSAGVEAGRAATSSSATDGGTMTLLALRKKKAPAMSTLFGAAFNPHNSAAYDSHQTEWGGLQVVRSYDNGLGAGQFAGVQPLDVAHHAASSFSFKYDPSGVISGSHDAEIRAFFQGIQDDHPVYWTYYHEPDDQLYVSHAFTPTDYRAAWKHIRGIADSVKATRPKLDVHATLIIMEYSMRPANATKRPLEGADGMYPGDDVIDVFGVDAYNLDASTGGEWDPATQFGKVIDFAKAHAKPWAIGEFGSCVVSGDTGGRAKYMDAALSYFADSGYPPVYVAYFDDDNGKCDYRMESDSAAISIWHQAMTQGIGSFQ